MQRSPIIIYLVLAAVSATSSLVFFHLGGSLAEMTGQSQYGFSFKAGGALAGFLIVFWVSLQVIERLYGISSLTTEKADETLPNSYSFSAIMSEISETVRRLEKDDRKLIKLYIARNDGARLFDGLFSSLLYASGAAITGVVDSRFYGNMMEWDSTSKQLRVRYFSGPYNDEIITRNFPIEGPGQGVASDALTSVQIQVKNKMDSELKEKGEARLYSMISVPIEVNWNLSSRQIVIINVDAGLANVFPSREEWMTSDVKNRLEQLAKLVSRVNTLYRMEMEDA